MDEDIHKGCALPFFSTVFFVLIFTSLYIANDTEWGEHFSVMRSNASIFDCESFIQKYPDSKYNHEVYKQVAFLLNERDIDNYGYSSDRDTYPMSVSSYVSTFEDLYDKYSDNTEFVTILSNAYTQKSAEYWKELVARNDAKGIFRYPIMIVKPYNRVTDEEYASVVKKVWGDDENAWKIAQSYNEEWAYDYYASIYPNGAHENEAIEMATELAMHSINTNENVGELPPANKGSSTGTKYSVISIYNDTEYRIKVVYKGCSGEPSHKEIIRAHESTKINLLNGKYNVGAQVLNGNIHPYHGPEELDGSYYNVEYYISSNQSYDFRKYYYRN